MTGCLLGVETEYGLAPSEQRTVCLGRLLQLARELPHVPGLLGSDLFLANGARLYADCGEHAELATPECTTPAEVVRYILAGELKRAIGDHQAAFAAYEERLGAFIAGKQQAAVKLSTFFAPRSRFGLFLRSQITKLVAIPFVMQLAVGREFIDRIELPEY